MASSIRTKSPSELVTTADRMALAPFGTLTNDGVSPSSEGMSQAALEHSSLLLALSGIGLRADGVGTNALHAAARVTMEERALILGSERGLGFK